MIFVCYTNNYIDLWIFFFFFFEISAEDAQLTPVLRLGAGACAGIIAMSATYPMDMVRGRLTVQVHILVSLHKFFTPYDDGLHVQLSEGK